MTEQEKYVGWCDLMLQQTTLSAVLTSLAEACRGRMVLARCRAFSLEAGEEWANATRKIAALAVELQGVSDQAKAAQQNHP